MYVQNDEGQQMTWADIQRQERAPAPRGFAFHGSFSGAENGHRVFAMDLREALHKLREHERGLPAEWGRRLNGVYQHNHPGSEKCVTYLVRFQMFDGPGIINW